MRRAILLVALGGCTLYFDGPSPETTEPDPHPFPDAAPHGDANVDAPTSNFLVDEPGTYAMQVDGEYLYWVDNGQFDHIANVRRAPLAGGTIQTLLTTSERIYDFAIADGVAYVPHTFANQGEILRVPLDGGPTTTLATPFNPTSISVDGSWVYFSVAVSPGGSIWRVPTTGGALENVATNVDNPWDLVARDGVLFYSEMNRGRMMRVVPGSAPTVLAQSTSWIGTGWMDVDATHVYFTACPTSQCQQTRLYRIPRDGAAAPTQIATVPSANEAKLSVASGRILWGRNEIVLDASGTGTVRALAGSGYAIGVAATSNRLYYADFFTGAIYASE